MRQTGLRAQGDVLPVVQAGALSQVRMPRAVLEAFLVETGRAVTTRRRPLVHLSLSPDALSRLAEIATRCGETRSGVVERLIRECEMPRPKTAGKPER
jgi:hypothetical protein